MSVIPGFVKKRASNEYNRGYSPKKLVRGFLGVTLLFAVADAGNVKDGIVDWMGSRGGDVANAAEIAGPVIVGAGSVAIDGTQNALNGFQQEFDGDLPAVPSIEISTADNSQSSETGYIIQSDDSYYSILGGLGMSNSSIAACDAAVDLNSQPVLIAGRTFDNPC